MRVLVTCVLLTVLVPSVSSQELSPTASPENAVFQIITYDRDPASDGLFHGHGFGTGFFIDADGTALTASHVTYSAVATRNNTVFSPLSVRNFTTPPYYAVAGSPTTQRRRRRV